MSRVRYNAIAAMALALAGGVMAARSAGDADREEWTPLFNGRNGGVVTGFDPAVKRDGTPLRDGYIALQAEGQPVEFRNVKLLNLSGFMDPKAANYKSYYVRRDDSKCVAGPRR